MRIYHTAFFITVSSHISVTRYGTDHVQAKATAMRDFTMGTFNQMASFREVFGNQIVEGRITVFNTEVGRRRHTLHAHFILRLEGTAPLQLRGVNVRIQDFFAAFQAGNYVRAILLNTSRENYIAKHGHPPRHLRFTAGSSTLVSDREELARLVARFRT
jgi:hypothetical protein